MVFVICLKCILNSSATRPLKINRSVMISFRGSFETMAFTVMFDVLDCLVKILLKWVQKDTVLDPKDFKKKIEAMILLKNLY